MRTTYLLISAAIAATPIAAQPGVLVSSPNGYEWTEGGTDSRDVLGTLGALRYQQIDSENPDPLPSRDRLAFRRDGHLRDNPDYAGRTLDLEVVMAESDLAAISTVLDNNYKTNVVTVFDRKQIQLPDWTQQPPLMPAPADAMILFDRPWSYPGRTASGNDLLWEVKVWSNDQAGKDYPFDFQYVVRNAQFGILSPSRSGHFDLGFGCQVPPRGESHMDMDVWNHGDKFAIDAHLHTVPLSPVIYTFNLFNAAVQIPGWCAQVHALPGATIVAGLADFNGDHDLDIDPLPYNATWIGIDLYAQAVAIDSARPGIPILSSGVVMTIPGDPRPPAVGRVWGFTADAQFGVGPFPGGIIVQTAHP